jgi:hypothetical protein
MAREAKKFSSARRQQNNHTAKLKAQDWTLGLEIVNRMAAAIDVGNQEHWVAVPPSLDPEPIRRFGCFTEDLRRMAEWLKSLGITTVAIAYASHCTSMGR